nr:MAG TPA: minor tail protein [Caudoviricetes sp.]
MSEVTIDSIAIEVDSSAALSADGIEKLSKSLADLRSNAKLTTSINNLNKLKTALNGLSNTSASAKSINQLTTALGQLARIQDPAGLRKTLSSLNKLPTALGKISSINLGQTASHLNALSQAVKPLSGIGKSNLGTLLNQLSKVPDISKKLDTRSISEFAMKIQQLTTAMKPLAAQMDAVARGFAALPTNINKAANSLNNYNKAQEKSAAKHGLLSGAIGSLKTKWLAYAYSYQMIADILQQSMDSFNDRYENMNLFSVAMGKYADDAYNYAEKVSQALGINMSDWARFQGVFMQLGTGFGIATDKAYSMSRGLTELTYDISSFFNLPIEEAYNKVASGITGELEPLRRLGYALDEATLQQVAYRNGINMSMQSMTQAEKAQIRYIAMVEQSGNVIGDMARTLVSPANAIRILRAQISSLAQTFGMLVSVVAAKVIPILQAIVIVVTKVINAISILLTGKGLKQWDKSAFNVATNYGSAASAANDAAGAADKNAKATKKAADNAKKMKQYMMGWDELNVIDTSADKAAGGGGAGGVGGGGGLGGSDLGLDLDSLWTEDMLKSLDKQAQDLADTIWRMLPLVAGVGTAFGAWKIGHGLYKAVTDLNKAMKGFAAAKGIASAAGDFKTLGSALLMAGGAALFFGGMWDSFMNGINWLSLAEQIGGVGLAWLGVDMIFKNSPFGKTVKAIMLFATGIEMLYKAFQEIISGDASAATVAQAIVGIGLVAGGVATKFGPIPGLITAAVGAIALAAVEIYTHWDQIKAYFANIDFKELAEAGAKAIVNFTDSVADGLPQAIESGSDIIVSFINGVTDNISSVIQSGVNVLTALINGIAAALPDLIVAVVNVIGTVVLAVIENLPKIIEAGVKLLLALAEGIIKSLPEIAKAAVKIIGALLEGIGKLTASVIAAGVQIIVALVKGIGNTIGQVLTKGGEAVTNFMNGIAGKIDNLIGKGKAMVEKVLTGIGNKFQDLYNKGASIIAEIIRGIREKIDDLKTIGRDIVDGLVKGISKGADKIAEGARNMGGTLVGALKKKLKVNSPSRVAAEIGDFFVQGLTGALDDGVKAVVSSAKTIGDALIQSMNGTLDVDALTSKESESTGNKFVNGLVGALSDGASKLIAPATTLGSVLLGAMNKQFDMDDSEDDEGEFNTYGSTMVQSLTDGLSSGQAALYNTLKMISANIKTIMNDLVATTQAQARQIIEAAQQARAAASSMGDSYASIGVRGYAQGGSVPSGDLFVAREAGPELVGRIGNSTTVMNNDQIVSAVASGVAKAVSSVMTATSGKTEKVEVYLDGEKIYNNQKKIARSKGVEFNMGAFAR